MDWSAVPEPVMWAAGLVAVVVLARMVWAVLRPLLPLLLLAAALVAVLTMLSR